MCGLIHVLRSAVTPLPSQEAYEALRAAGIARPSDIAKMQQSGETRFAKEVRFARRELVDAGLMANHQPGAWDLTLRGWETALTIEGARELVRRRRHEQAERSTMVLPRSGPTTGPAPVTWMSVVGRSAEAITATYVFRFGSTPVWKIGLSSDIGRRLTTFNQHIPEEVVDGKWLFYCSYPSPDAAGAYEMEQELLGRLKEYRSAGERVICSEVAILDAWRRSIEVRLER